VSRVSKKAGLDRVTFPDFPEPVALHFHDVRGTTVTLLSEAGCTVQQIATITGHSLRTVNQPCPDQRPGRTGHDEFRELSANKICKPAANRPQGRTKADRKNRAGTKTKMARPKRFELLTPRFVVWCSIQLSYGRLIPLPEPARGTGHSYRLDPLLARLAASTRVRIRQARARSPRLVSRSTARSGIVMLKVAPIVPGTRRISPPCARTSSAAMARPRPVPPARAEPWKA
jgi:hypothetical protein